MVLKTIHAVMRILTYIVAKQQEDEVLLTTIINLESGPSPLIDDQNLPTHTARPINHSKSTSATDDHSSNCK